MDLQDLMPKIAAFVTIALLLGVGLVVIQGFGNNYNIGWNTATQSNQSETFVNGTWINLHTDVESCPADVWAANGTDILTTDYECRRLSTQGGTTEAQIRLIGVTTGTTWNNSDVGINYTYRTATMAVIAVNDTQGALDDFPSWFGIIVVVLAAAVILGVVIKSFSGREMG